MVLYQFSVNKWVKPVIQRHKDAGRAEGRVEGLSEGRAQGRVEGLSDGRAEGRVEGLSEGRAEGRVEGLSEGRAEGRAEANRDWEAWLERKAAAESKGLTFDEPPPGASE